MVINTLNQWLSTGGNPTLKATLGNVCRHCWLSQLGEKGATSQGPAMLLNILHAQDYTHNKELSSPKCQ